jgi:mannose-6-phosphate isomerase-like protein (cupin superfamily)
MNKYMKSFVGNIKKIVMDNNSYRKVIDTGKYTQLVIMSLKPLEDIPLEVHNDMDQVINIVDGNAQIMVNDQQYDLSNDDIILIKAGNKHYVKNINANKSLKLYTTYSPAEHPDKLEQIVKQNGGTKILKYKINYS